MTDIVAMPKVQWERMVILGVGLIGGSLARAVRLAGICREVVGWGRNPATLERALALEVVDRIETDLATAVRGADLVVAAVPPGVMEALFRELAGMLGPETVLTDVGSTKGSVVTAARAAFGTLPAHFVPGHPIAGNERSGVEAADANLFNNRLVILTPLPETDSGSVSRVRALWEVCGAEITEMEVEHHDTVLAATSHLPHLLAFTLVDVLARMDDSWEIFHYAAGGFRDFTRIAGSDPVMWRDICLANRTHLLAMLDRYRDGLDQMATAITTGDGDRLHQIFSHARAAREYFSAQKNMLKPSAS
ncbi:prephenate dehydrogenase [Gammaproteobacteria bacterium]